ncbi:FAD-binding protein [Blastococcus brunescens]|uniref:FAD-binding protein n=1 Tax=Blastococcus brunescens TaxID=1564165 RepID=A0ABZ1B2X7_9ACTN|nr:FAD-binding protein [Blastococcus sp. BMG 8361]WRL65171.1 FAD-binding protein [Blastococcus sp. BMG 8361]
MLRTRTWRNWAGNQRAAGIEVVCPAGAEEIAAQVRRAAASGRRVRPIGSGHSFAAIGRPEDIQLALDRHAAMVGVDASGLVTVQAGMPLHRLNAELAARGGRSPTSATSTGRRSRARSPPVPTAPAPASAAWPRSCAGSSSSSPTGRCCTARRPRTPTSSLSDGSASERSASSAR